MAGSSAACTATSSPSCRQRAARRRRLLLLLPRPPSAKCAAPVLARRIAAASQPLTAPTQTAERGRRRQQVPRRRKRLPPRQRPSTKPREPGSLARQKTWQWPTRALRLPAWRSGAQCVACAPGGRKERLQFAELPASDETKLCQKFKQNWCKVRSWRTSFSARRAPPYPIFFGVGCSCGRGVSSPLHPHRSSQPPTLPSFSSLRRKARPPAQRQRPPTCAAPLRNIRARKRSF